MAVGIKISQLPEIPASDISGSDSLLVLDNETGRSNRITLDEHFELPQR
jgi:hypothetical protein